MVALLAACAPRERESAPENQGWSGERRAIWAAIQPMAAQRGLDPLFVYALVKSESNLDPRAQNGEARGLMQLKPGAWRKVSRLPYETDVWVWRANLEVGMDSLASMRMALARKGVLSFPMLWASYHYGLDFTSEHGFDMSRIPRPSDPISYRLWSGDFHPLEPPK